MKYLILIGLTFATSSFAAKPYGMAGCGFGSQIHGKEGNQILAATTNGTSGNQTFGISSGTSNCVTATEKTAQIKNFIEANYAALVTEMAKGQGDSLMTLSSFYGCDQNLFAAELKQNFETIAPKSEDATKVLVNINNTISDSKALQANCTHAI